LPAEFVAPVEVLSQGDLLLAAPSVYVRSPAYLIQEEKNRFVLRHTLPASGSDERVGQMNVRETVEWEGEDAFGNAWGARRPGLVLSHGCELDKPGTKRYVLLAQVRPLEQVADEHKESIRTFHQKRAFYLPSTEHLDGEQFADLRMITTLRRSEVVDTLDRVATLNDHGVLHLQAHLFRFFVRRRLPDDWTTWPEDAD
jgi:hypothetical protein